MRDIIILLLTVFTLILTVQEGFTQETSLNNNIRITKLDNRIYKITFNPKHVINVVVLTGPEGVLFSDAAFEGTEKDLDEIIRNIGGGDIKYIINTHWHPDRTVLNNITGSNAGIISHLNSKIRSSEKQTIGEYKIDPLPDESLPAITFTEEMELFFNDEVVRMISLPGGHSDSDILVYFTKAKILYLGDLLFSESFPYIDVNNGASLDTYIKNIKSILDTYPDDVRIIAGHGKDFTKNDLSEYYNMLNETIDIIKKAKDSGKSLSQMKDENILKEFKLYSGFFEDITTEYWIETVYNTLKD